MKPIIESILDTMHEYFVIFPPIGHPDTVDHNERQENDLFEFRNRFRPTIKQHLFAEHIEVKTLIKPAKPWNKELAERVKQIKRNHRRK